MSDDGHDKVCSICWEELSQPSVLLECGHRFHYKCLSEWGKRSSKCPMCRQDFQDNDSLEESNPDTPIQEYYVDFTQLHNIQHQQEEIYWWQAVCQGLAFFSTSITIIRFLALLFPHTIHRIFNPQIQAGKQLQTYFSYLRTHLKGYIPTILLAAYLCCYPLNVAHA